MDYKEFKRTRDSEIRKFKDNFTNAKSVQRRHIRDGKDVDIEKFQQRWIEKIKAGLNTGIFTDHNAFDLLSDLNKFIKELCGDK